jgi:signal transduction histidine kinase
VQVVLAVLTAAEDLACRDKRALPETIRCTYAGHHTPQIYGLQSYISMPIRLTDGSFFGTLCAIDPEPHRLNTPETIQMFASVIGFHLSAIDRVRDADIRLTGEQARAALREQFVAVLGHELRNPLAAIDGGMHLPLRTPLNEQAASIVRMVQSSVKRMNGLIENVMDLARSRLGHGLNLNRNADQPLEPMLRQVIAKLQTASMDRVIDVHLNLTEPVKCDRESIGELLSNLLGTAMTHSPHDKPISIGATTLDGELEILVANAGDPISPEKMDVLFEPFTRGSMQGLGLGLYICQEIAKAHGGKVNAISSEEETRFTFRMPLH